MYFAAIQLRTRKLEIPSLIALKRVQPWICTKSSRLSGKNVILV